MLKNRDFWDKRLNALSKAFEHTYVEIGQEIDRIKEARKQDDQERLKLETVQLSNLQTFLTEWFEYTALACPLLIDGFYPDPKTQEAPYLAETKKLPASYVLSAVLTQLSIDFHIAQQSFNQRRRSDYGVLSHQSNILADIDRITMLSILPAIFQGLLPIGLRGLTTYLQETIEIRLVPFIDSFFVGVPFTTPPFDVDPFHYLIIPHEVGHYLYWHGQTKSGEIIHDVLEKALSNVTTEHRWQQRWLEELFADIYGCIIAGPANVRGFQELLIDGLPSHFNQDTDEHPIPQLRPLILTHVLRRIQEKHGPNNDKWNFIYAPDALDKHWQDYVAFVEKGESMNLSEKKFAIQADPAPIVRTGKGIITDLTDIIDTMLDILEPLQDLHGLPWTEDLPKENQNPDLLFVALKDLSNAVYFPEAKQSLPVSQVLQMITLPRNQDKSKIINDLTKFADELDEMTTPVSIAENLELFFAAGWKNGGGGTAPSLD